ncbi:M48 family metallopeptidase [Tenacibaculum aiptasiae]|uniref:M48 family metallopeptidase n=1 Tax=Tenacibaculum aiptasiae TaxID=426481 RepID=A0A7J5ANR2_9FLAO|nr:M48 family metallopeptidase [Tenacibaculum aiptasiae]KAB1158619.1 M48 family metallopeptidase [Tenacibaculum aiptasiae]
MKRSIALAFLTVFLIQCSTVPITGRKRINFVSDSQVLPASFAQYKGFLEKNKLSKNVAKSNQIKRVGKKISAAVDRFMRANGMVAEANAYKWEFNLIEDKTVNAWCLPGGKVVFYTGILPMCANEDGVAAVMGHEVAHAFAKHGQERMSTGQLQQLGGAAVALGTQNSENAKIWNMAYGIGSQVGVMLPFSRKHETEADKLGLVFMIMAGYNGEEAAEVWVRMSQRAKGKQPAQILSTHPSNEERIKTLRAFLPEARSLAAKYNVPAKK